MRSSYWSSDVFSSDVLVTAGLDIVAFAAFLAPPALLGVGLVALWNRPETGWLYGSWLIIALGYVGRYAAIGVRAFAAACAQLPATIEDAARVFGAGYGSRLARIVVPLHARAFIGVWLLTRSEEHTSELQSLMRISYAVFC